MSGPEDEPVDVPLTIPCIDCGGTCHLLSVPHEDGWRPGDLATYRCADCLDRWDTIVPGDPDDE